MTHSSSKDYWTPKALYSAKQLAMVSYRKDTSLLPSYPAASAAITSKLEAMADEMEPGDLGDLASQLEMDYANSQEIALALTERSIVSQILADVNWNRQKASQPPTAEILTAIDELTIWDYLESAMVMR